ILYFIDRESKQVDKVNYATTANFIAFQHYVVFNDSVNLVKYNLINQQYSLLISYETDLIDFVIHNPRTDQGIVKINMEDHFLIQHFNFESQEKKQLPKNLVNLTQNMEYFAIKNEDNFEIYNIDGILQNRLKDKFSGFSYQNQVLLQEGNQVFLSNLELQDKEFLLQIPETSYVQHIISLKDYFIFQLDYEIVILTPDYDQVIHLKGKLLNQLATGLFFENENQINYYSFNHPEVVFIFENLPRNFINSDAQSSIFAVKEKEQVKIYNLSKLF
ncbi:MAG: hypothetical protein MJB14_07635, partial [Spirochaetes bacterium]|nr:hypothetical protein [Spirochaetota bacterium]